MSARGQLQLLAIEVHNMYLRAPYTRPKQRQQPPLNTVWNLASSSESDPGSPSVGAGALAAFWGRLASSLRSRRVIAATAAMTSSTPSPLAAPESSSTWCESTIRHMQWHYKIRMCSAGSAASTQWSLEQWSLEL